MSQIFLTGATAVAITTIGKDLNFKQSDLQWPLNVYSYALVLSASSCAHAWLQLVLWMSTLVMWSSG